MKYGEQLGQDARRKLKNLEFKRQLNLKSKDMQKKSIRKNLISAVGVGIATALLAATPAPTPQTQNVADSNQSTSRQQQNQNQQQNNEIRAARFEQTRRFRSGYANTIGRVPLMTAGGDFGLTPKEYGIRYSKGNGYSKKTNFKKLSHQAKVKRRKK